MVVPRNRIWFELRECLRDLLFILGGITSGNRIVKTWRLSDWLIVGPNKYQTTIKMFNTDRSVSNIASAYIIKDLNMLIAYRQIRIVKTVELWEIVGRRPTCSWLMMLRDASNDELPVLP